MLGNIEKIWQFEIATAAPILAIAFAIVVIIPQTMLENSSKTVAAPPKALIGFLSPSVVFIGCSLFSLTISCYNARQIGQHELCRMGRFKGLDPGNL